MNKGDLVDAVAKDAGISKGEAQAAVDSVVENVKKALKKGTKVTLVGFGTFSTSKRSAREGRNPQTGKPIKIPAKKVAKFTPGKALKDAIN
jgi:DNA-binding protein HU-beta